MESEKWRKKQGSLKKYQLFYQTVCETLQVNDE
jgi:hypothetical protein